MRFLRVPLDLRRSPGWGYLVLSVTLIRPFTREFRLPRLWR